MKQGVIIGLIAITLVSFLLAGLFTWMGGGRMIQDTEQTEPFIEEISIPRGTGSVVEIQLSIGSGTVMIRPMPVNETDMPLMNATVRSWEPVKNRITTDERDELTVVSLSQKEGDIFNVSAEGEEWNVFVNPTVPLSLSISMGTGDARVYLSGMNVTSLSIGNGGGVSVVEVIDLKNEHLPIRLVNGIGHSEVILPENSQITARIKNGIGETRVTGFTRTGDTWTHTSEDITGPSISLALDQGIGDIALYTL